MTARPAAGSLESFDIITDWDALAGLAPEWEALWRRNGAAYLIESFGWADLSWRNKPDGRAGTLFCVAARRNRRLALVWPLIIRRERLWRIAQPLATLWGDYSSVLAENDAAAPEMVARAWRLARRCCPADLIALPFVREHGVLAGVLGRPGRMGIRLGVLPAPFVAWDGISGWEGYLRGRDPSHRRDLARKHRRLAAGGGLAVEEITDPAAADPVIDWMLHHKARWLDHAGKPDATHIRAPPFRTFLRGSMARFGPAGRLVLFVLRQGEAIIAADLSSVEDVRVGWYMGTFDDARRKYSPGQVLKKHTLRWAFDRGLAFDMRLGDGEHKRFWCNGVESTSSWRFAVSARGAAYVLAKRAQALARRRG